MSLNATGLEPKSSRISRQSLKLLQEALVSLAVGVSPLKSSWKFCFSLRPSSPLFSIAHCKSVLPVSFVLRQYIPKACEMNLPDNPKRPCVSELTKADKPCLKKVPG